MKRRVVDIHPHIISTDTRAYPRDPLWGRQSAWSQERPVSTEQLLQAMDEAGVAKAAIVQASTCYGFDNRYVADAVAAYPDRFAGVFSVDMRAPDAPERIRYWVGRKLTGLRLFTAGSTIEGQAPGLDDPASFPAWDCAAELGIPVCVQMRIAGVPQLRVLLARYPSVTIILDHFFSVPLEEGAPYEAARDLFSLAEHPNVYWKLTPVILGRTRQGRATPQSFFERAFKEFGASRIAWGSNFPASAGSLGEILRDAGQALSWASEDDLAWVFHKTAEHLYPALKANPERQPAATNDARNKESA